jgi:hypothetical protein
MDKWRGGPSMQQIADWPKMLDLGRLPPCFIAYWTTSLTLLARQMRAERLAPARLRSFEANSVSPIWSHLLRAIAARYRLIRYDERGNGLSDWDVEDISLEASYVISRVSLTPMA